MNTWARTFAPLIGRILMGGFFLWNGIQEIINLSATTVIFIQTHLPQPAILAIIVATIEVIGGIMLIVGYKTRLWATLLIIYLLVTSILLFNISSGLQIQLFLENMGIVGGLLYMVAYSS